MVKLLAFGMLYPDMHKNIRIHAFVTIGLNSTENNDVTISLSVWYACPQIQVLHGGGSL
jgi:hypothetical protein